MERKKRDPSRSTDDTPGDQQGATMRKKPRLESRKKRPGIAQEIYSETTYYTQNGLRYVKPYYFTFTTHAKGRWVGSKIFDVFCREFQSETPVYYENAIKSGKVTVDGKVATMETVVNNNELITHRVHRHEPPVTAMPLNIIHQDEDLIILDKPASIPVHPCGRYRHNSVVFLLAKEHNLPNLHTVHRLDRLTSGLLMFARSVSKAQEMESQIRERRVSKVYVCRVEGEFPSKPVECNEPILVVSHKVGVCHVDPTGKDCFTRFTRLSFNGETSVVKCEPKTGRMHQIRVHLQWLGYPIVNDPIYNHPAWKQSTSQFLHSDDNGGQHSKEKDTGPGVEANILRVIREIVRTNYSSEEQASNNQSNTQSEAAFGKGNGLTTLSAVNNDSDTLLKQDYTPVSCEKQEGPHEAYSSIGGVQDSKDTSPGRDLKIEAAKLNQGDEKDAISKECSASIDLPICSVTTTTESSQIVTKLTSGTAGKEDTKSPFLSEQRLEIKDADCTECQLSRPDPSPSDLVMFLHALSYKGEGWEFSTAMPAWADPEWKETFEALDHNILQSCKT